MHQYHRAVLALALLSLATVVHAQTKIVVPVGSDVFPDLQYQGGDATQAKRLVGILLLSDSTVAFFACSWDCDGDARKLGFWDKPTFRIPLTAIRDVSHSTLTRTPPTIFSDDTMDFFTIVYEHDGTVDAPLFKMKRATSGAIEAKLKYRMKKIGLTLDTK